MIAVYYSLVTNYLERVLGTVIFMTVFILAITILCLAIPFYVYIGYPLLLVALSKVKRCVEIDKRDIEPKVSLLVSCYNEEKVIRKKIENCLSLDYPNEKLEIIFISDGSEDGTDEIINAYQDQGIHLIRQEGRLGKTSGLNLAIPEANGEVIVFSDANAMYQSDAINKLVRSFHDTTVGYVVGAALYSDGEDNSAANSENSYWQYEIFIKTLESKLHSVVGGDGAIYAIRRSLYDPLDAKDINDFVNPLQIIAKGYRGVFEPEAICYEETAGDFSKEAKRKERIVNRSFRGLMKVKSVMNPFKVGFFSLEVISHKLLRWLIPFFLVGMTLGIIILSFQGLLVFQIMQVFGVLFVWLAMVGYLKASSNSMSRVFQFPYYFMMANISSFIGVVQAVKGNIQVTWGSPRAEQTEETADRLSVQFIFASIALISLYLFYNAASDIFQACMS